MPPDAGIRVPVTVYPGCLILVTDPDEIICSNPLGVRVVGPEGNFHRHVRDCVRPVIKLLVVQCARSFSWLA